MAARVWATRMGVPVGFRRSVGNAHGTLLPGCFMDELAADTRQDHRLYCHNMLTNPPCHLAAEKAGWASNPSSGRAMGCAAPVVPIYRGRGGGCVCATRKTARASGCLRGGFRHPYQSGHRGAVTGKYSDLRPECSISWLYLMTGLVEVPQLETWPFPSLRHPAGGCEQEEVCLWPQRGFAPCIH